MRKIIRVSAAAATAAALVVAGGLAYADTQPRPRHHFTLTSTNGPFAVMDFNEPGDGMGDQFTYLNPLLRDGVVIGSEAGQCTIMEYVDATSPQSFNCINTLELPGGQITTMVLAHTDGPQPMYATVTGGSGIYRDAGGQIAVTFLEDGSKLLEFQLS